jgi:sodium/bile acid cotransporter 7
VTNPQSAIGNAHLQMLAHIRKQWFLLALVAILVIGMVWPEELGKLADAVPRQFIVATVLFLMSFTLDSQSMHRAIRSPAPTLLAVFISFGLAPPLAWLAGRQLDGELAVGLVIAASVPCTLASAAVWTRRARGNDAVAMLVTMITNFSCFVITPAWLALLAGRSARSLAENPAENLPLRLIKLAVVPILAGQLCRKWPPAAALADRRRTALGVAAQFGILSIVFVGAVVCGQKFSDSRGALSIGFGTLVFVVAAVAIVHLSLLITGIHSARMLGMNRADSIAVAIAGSQKTLMIGLDIALEFGGLTILPVVAYHVVQLVLDTLIADRLAQGAIDAAHSNSASG